MSSPTETVPPLDARRREIEEIDRALISLIADRVRLAREVGRLKQAAGQPLLDPAREAAVVRRAAELANALALPGEPVRAIFWQLIGLCRGAQHDGAEQQ